MGSQFECRAAPEDKNPIVISPLIVSAFVRFSVFLRNGVLTINTNAKTDEGLWYLQEPFVSIALDEGAEKIGLLLVDMLGRTQTAVSNEAFTQEYLSQLFAKLLDAVGVSSVDELVGGQVWVACSE